ncbi:MAG: hypothetical protein PHC86_00725 [Eubacteriales bacterium]|nr:hypothetical protein [Eubacteriales bacterium]
MPDQDFLTQIHEAEAQAEAIQTQTIETGRLNQDKSRQQAVEQIAQARQMADENASARLEQARQDAQNVIKQSAAQSEKAAQVIQAAAQNRLNAATQAVLERIVSDSVGR